MKNVLFTIYFIIVCFVTSRGQKNDFFKDTIPHNDTASNIQEIKERAFVYLKEKDSTIENKNFDFLRYDSTKGPRMLLRPYFENGVNQFKSDTLKSLYGTTSVYYFGFGFQFGHPQKFRFIPFAQVSFSKYHTDRVLYMNSKSDSMIWIRQVTAGIYLPFYKFKQSYLRLKLAYSVSLLTETFHQINKEAVSGLHVGIGIEQRFVGYTRLYAEISHIYQKYNQSVFRDFDMTRLAIGWVL